MPQPYSQHAGFFLTLVFATVFSGLFVSLSHDAWGDKVVATIPVGHNPGAITVNPNTDKIYVVTKDYPSFTGYVSVIDGTTNNVMSTIPMGNNPSDIKANPATNLIYVGNYSGWSISVIDGKTDTLVKTIPNAGPVWGIGINPVTNMIYAADYGNGNGVVVINGATNTIVSKISFANNEIAHQPTVNTNTNMVYVPVTCSYCKQSYITVINGTTNARMTNIPAGMQPHDSDANPKTNMIYVSDDSNTYQLDVINGSNNSLSTIPMNSCAAGVGDNPNTNLIYVTNCQENYTYIVDGNSNSIIGKLPVGGFPSGVAVDPNTNRIYISNSGDDQVSVIQGGTSSSQIATSTLTVTSQDNTGKTLTGFYTTLSSNGNQAVTGFTPVQFTLNDSQTYAVSVTNYGKYVFDHWADTSSSGATRSISIMSNTTIMAVYDTTPQPPTNLVATPVSPSQINLSWNVPSNNGGTSITGYEIQKSTDGGSTWSTLVANTGSTTTSYSDSGLDSNTTYSYRVMAINSVGTSNPSNTASATTPILSAAGINVGPVGTALP